MVVPFHIVVGMSLVLLSDAGVHSTERRCGFGRTCNNATEVNDDDEAVSLLQLKSAGAVRESTHTNKSEDSHLLMASKAASKTDPFVTIGHDIKEVDEAVKIVYDLKKLNDSKACINETGKYDWRDSEIVHMLLELNNVASLTISSVSWLGSAIAAGIGLLAIVVDFTFAIVGAVV
eukprot:gnl/TRDRNA2_/TRDRNA2_135926_c0_seq1.p2 gnl/TRDRNA2_/TRDRNA2_135926_c0~~gnl/TRDRNA2_/TRDRNA2_135926_c0_seq1.p2  ORF type:complete len:176 (-),score=21.94 gnl/TRDRNA2_/TRDRNA2_135926_c0_seq1:276-803(-)